MESAEAILENENNSNVESESNHIRQQLSNLNANNLEDDKDGDGPDFSETNVVPGLNDTSLGEDLVPVKTSSDQATAAVKSLLIYEGSKEGGDVEKDVEVLQGCENNGMASGSSNSVTDAPSGMERDLSENQTEHVEISGITKNYAKEESEKATLGDSAAKIDDGTVNSSLLGFDEEDQTRLKTPTDVSNENCFDEDVQNDGDIVSQTTSFTRESENKGLLHFSPLGDDDVDPEPVSNGQSPTLVEEKDQSLSNYDDTPMEVEETSCEHHEGAQKVETGNDEMSSEIGMEWTSDKEAGSKEENVVLSPEEENVLLTEDTNKDDNPDSKTETIPDCIDSPAPLVEGSPGSAPICQSAPEEFLAKASEGASQITEGIQKESVDLSVENIDGSLQNDVKQNESQNYLLESKEKSDEKITEIKETEQPPVHAMNSASENMESEASPVQTIDLLESKEGSDENITEIEETEQPSVHAMNSASENMESEASLVQTIDESLPDVKSNTESEQPLLESTDASSKSLDSCQNENAPMDTEELSKSNDTKVSKKSEEILVDDSEVLAEGKNEDSDRLPERIDDKSGEEDSSHKDNVNSDLKNDHINKESSEALKNTDQDCAVIDSDSDKAQHSEKTLVSEQIHTHDLEESVPKDNSSSVDMTDNNEVTRNSNREELDTARRSALPGKEIKKEVEVVDADMHENDNSQVLSKEVKKEAVAELEQGGDDVVVIDDNDESPDLSVKKEGHDRNKATISAAGIQIAAVSGQEYDLHADASDSTKSVNEHPDKVEKSSSKSKTQTCIVCQKVTKCKFNIVRGGDTKQLCDDVCFKKFRKSPASFLTKSAPPPSPHVSQKQAPTAVKLPIVNQGGSDGSKTKTPVSIAPRVTPSRGVGNQYKTCSVCQVLNVQTSRTFCNWKGFDFCGEICLGKFQSTIHTTCSNCYTFVPNEVRASYCTKIGNAMHAFCKQACLVDFMKKLRSCACCKQALTLPPVIAVVGVNDKPKEFCSRACVKKLEDQVKDVEIVHVEPPQGSVDKCSVCNSQAKAAKHTVRFQTKTFKLCSDLCLSAFQYTNNINLNKCSSCGNMCTALESNAHFIQFEGETKRFCSDRCIATFRADNRKLTSCSWCAAKKINFDMIERQDENNKYQLFCSLNCLSLFRVNLQAKSNIAVECDRCRKLVPAQYHLTMSDASVRNFCSYHCVMAFQSQFTSRITPPLPASGGGSVPVSKPTASPVVQQPAVQAHPHGTRSRGKKTPVNKPKTQQSTPAANNSSIPVISSVMSLASTDAPPPAPPPAPPESNVVQMSQEKVMATFFKNLEKKGTLVTGDGRQRIVVESPLPKMTKNKAVQCKPACQTKATACRPHSQSKEIQTDDHLGKPVIIPIPVPIYIPMPTVMYNAPAPVPVPFAVPIPIPIFIPTTRKSANGILRTIKELQERMPADPLEAEMLMMAEAVASDGKAAGDSDTDSEADAGDNDYDTAADDSDPKSGMKEKEGGGAEDMIQMALRMAEEMSGPVEDLETSVQPVAVNSVSTPQRQPEPHPVIPSPNNVVDRNEDPDYTPIKAGRTRGTKRAPRGRPASTVSTRPKRQRTGRSYVEPEEEARDTPPPPVEIAEPPPDTNYRLKFTYGVNAWKHWVVAKNAELENVPKKNNRVRPLPLDVLKCTMDELHYSLCLFIKEVRKPNRDPYSPDSIYYLCLGIQQYLYENGRIDNIFTDLYFQRFTDSLHDILKSLQPKVNTQGQMLCRIEEEHLWESKQLGAHSPYVLLNTLIYFHTKHFILKNAADHMSLSFAQILKHWKKGVPVKGGQQSSAPKNASLRFYCLANKKQENSTVKKNREGGVPVYEVTENFDNPLRCPVKLYEFFLSKCPESIKNRNDIFYPIPERSCVPDSPVWYSTQSIEHLTMDKMLTRILLVREIQEAHLHAQPTYIKM